MPIVGRARGPSSRLLSAVAFALLTYVFVQSTAATLDHDLICHLKSRTHCTMCGSGAGVFAPGLTGRAAPPPVGHLPCTGTVEVSAERILSAPTLGAIQDRAPPA